MAIFVLFCKRIAKRNKQCRSHAIAAVEIVSPTTRLTTRQQAHRWANFRFYSEMKFCVRHGCVRVRIGRATISMFLF